MFDYRWNIKDGYPANGIDAHNLKVFGTFVCGGGSTMGYKLAGYKHLGGVEIDEKIAQVYKVNHNPKHLYNEDIRDFRIRDELPKELFDLDILDGSPPCSSFSDCGNREKDWNKKKKFSEGQKLQVLDNLFFEYISLAERLKPKVIIAENVTGLIKGNAKAYTNRIFKALESAGYNTQLFLLNAASMGVPQHRKRVFFIAKRKDLDYPKLKLSFNERAIPYKEFKLDIYGARLTKESEATWSKRKKTDLGFKNIHEREIGKPKRYNAQFIKDNKVSPILVSGADGVPIRMDAPYRITDNECTLIASFPEDYDFLSIRPLHILGMSVPPVMMAQVAHQIYLQWFKERI